MKMLRTIYFLILLLTTCYGSAVEDQKVIRVATFDYPPYCNAEAEGLGCDLVKAAFNAVGYDARFCVVPIRRGRVLLSNHQVDAMLGADLLNVQNHTLHSVHVYNVLLSLFFYEPGYTVPETVQSLNELQGRTVGIVTNEQSSRLLKPYGLEVVKVGTPQQFIKMLQKRHLDLALAPLLTGFYLIQDLVPHDAKDFDYMLISNLKISLNFNKQNSHTLEIKEEFEKGVQKIWDNGEYIRIMEQYWGKKNVPQAVLLHQYPMLGTDQSEVFIYLSSQRDRAGRINE